MYNQPRSATVRVESGTLFACFTERFGYQHRGLDSSIAQADLCASSTQFACFTGTVCLLYWYKSTNSDANGACSDMSSLGRPPY